MDTFLSKLLAYLYTHSHFDERILLFRVVWRSIGGQVIARLALVGGVSEGVGLGGDIRSTGAVGYFMRNI